ncbi:hypothetical protein GCM10008090_35170 [Arenicella chitinivorans]|uniref:HEPN domain-containing protein n=1 Tax=Arenicella chitinivorans TaxID=1329800 RepID=A0A918S2Y2_9GAMM|nr:hypothetical protein [Arenicella chitinivorans]GHA22378.1 hypothetical protein GCM10008090_35170 [Arenicella chitinivorans]
METHQKHEVASELLESALYHFYDSKSYFSALHCAGAAEEIFGRYVSSFGGKHSFETDKAALKSIALGLNDEELSDRDANELLNGAKNSTKHGVSDLSGCVKASARQMLERAIENYHLLTTHIELKEIEHLTRFETEK